MYKSIVEGKGGVSAKVVCDSISEHGKRITTLELRYPRFILAELNTHRMLSKNSSSSRAIPVEKIIEQVKNEPAMPIHWGKNQAGMQANEECDNRVFHKLELDNAGWEGCAPLGYNNKMAWHLAGVEATEWAEAFSEAGYHKQIVNRLIEPFQFMKTVITATEWDNFFKLRNHSAAQPEIQELARCMVQAMVESEPNLLEYGEWHMPYISEVDCYDVDVYGAGHLIKCSVARCARVSYMNHDNTTPSVEADIDLYDALVSRPYTMKNGVYLSEDDPIHGSPTEHCATPMYMATANFNENWWECSRGYSHRDRLGKLWSGNFAGWIQYRKLIGE